MHRCGVCDYTTEYGSSLLDKAPDPKIKVRWHEKYQGFLCASCITEIGLTLDDWDTDRESIQFFNSYKNLGPKY